jgi:molecular chaperone GrpE
LPVVDSLERALQVKSDAGEFRGGVELIYKQLQAALAKLSVNAIASLGEPFDPRYHEAIEMVETTEAPDHHVVDELQRGYKFKDRLLRPAMVKVARNPGK